MEASERNFIVSILALIVTIAWFASCGAPSGSTNLTSVNANSGVANSVSNSNLNINAGPSGNAVDAREPDQYQANIKLNLQTVGGNQQASIPTLGATVARSGADRVMEFMMPNNEKVIFLDKGGMNYLVLPNRKQYAELTRETLGFEVRRMMMPEQIVSQIKAIPGVTRAGEETMNGRQVVKYTYQSTANTQTQAGTVGTESYLLVDKETGLPLRSETVSQSKSGGNVNGVSGVRIVTEMTDIKNDPDANIFTLPPDYAKIDPQVVRAQVQAIFQVVGTFLGQMMNQAAQPQSNSNTNSYATPAASPRY